MKMRKMLSVLLVMVLAVSLLASCGKTAETPADNNTPAATTEEKKDDAQTTEPAKTDDGDQGGESAPAEETAAGSTPRNETLYFAGQQWGAINAWNPVHANANNWGFAGNENAREIIYETLFMYNLLDGKLYPLLGTSYSWNADKTELTVTLNTDAHFCNGEPVTADDVAYSFEIGRKYQTSGFAGIEPYIADVKAVDPSTVLISMVTENGVAKNPLMGLSYICSSYVLCKSYIQTVEARVNEDATAFKEDTMEDFVSSGPYRPYYNDDQKVIFVRDDNYWGQAASMWGKLPTPKYLAHNLFADNAAGNLAFSNGEVDVSQQFNIDIPSMMEKDPNISAYIDEAPYNVCTTMPTAFMQLDVPGLDSQVVRKAIAMAVDYDQIVTAAMGGQCPSFTQVPRSLMNPTDGEQALIDKNELKAYAFAGNDIAGANALLDEAGIVDTDGDGYREYNGTKLHFQAACPQGWSDWEASMEIVAAAGKAIGIEIETYFPESATYFDMFTNHNFQIGMWSPAGAGITSPWARVRGLMSSEFVGNMANWSGNWGWYENARADELIAAIPLESDETVLKSYYTELSKIYLDEVPSFSLMYRPNLFYNTNESVWSGFPAQDDGYNIPPTDCTDGYGIAGLYNVYTLD